tara:strand:+ start:14679 stop:15803 length:1125 start_codon:yes stop_codon:yes gene_type:complete
MKILFISHNAHRAGAQLLLLNFIRWLKAHHKNIDLEILMGGKGALLKEFEQLAKTYLVDTGALKKGNLSRLTNQIKNKKRINTINKNTYDLYYSNTILNGELLRMLNTGSTPVICHVHEMDYWISKAGAENIDLIKEKTSYFFSASKAVKSILTASYEIPESKIVPVYVPIDIKKILSVNQKQSLRSYLGLDKNTILIGACGTESFRKGKDWFIPIAVQVLEQTKNEKLHFVWIGGKNSAELQFDLNRCGYKNNIHFIEQLPDAHTYFNELSLFLMLSREDPFPTVNLEAGIWETPILCFFNTGGTNELIEDGCGFAVPYANLSAMTDKIIYLLANETERKLTGKRLKDKIIAKYDIEIIGSEMVRLIKQKINK